MGWFFPEPPSRFQSHNRPYLRDGKHFVLRADEKLTAFIELEAALQKIALTRWRNFRQRKLRGEVSEKEFKRKP